MFLADREAVEQLISKLIEQDYRVVGPRHDGAAIVPDDITSIDDLPEGWSDKQQPGSYSLYENNTKSLFRYTTSSANWKPWFQPQKRLLFTSTKKDQKLEISEDPQDWSNEKVALLGLRACDLAALAVLDNVFKTQGGSQAYERMRENTLIIAVDCSYHTDVCFCTSNNNGPACKSGYDLKISEWGDKEINYSFESGTKRGEEIMAELPLKKAVQSDTAARDKAIRENASSIKRHLDYKKAADLIAENQNSNQWEDIAERCIACGNCTMVCPTCFCTSVDDDIDLSGEHAERWERWESCFSLDFSYLHGGSIRSSVSSRYRHWLTHKLANWHHQFGEAGCIGCGRCITWCPPGIDLTEECAKMAEEEKTESAQ